MSSSSVQYLYEQNAVQLIKPAPTLERQPDIVSTQDHPVTNQEQAVAEQIFGLLCWTFWAGEAEGHRSIAAEEEDEEVDEEETESGNE